MIVYSHSITPYAAAIGQMNKQQHIHKKLKAQNNDRPSVSASTSSTSRLEEKAGYEETLRDLAKSWGLKTRVETKTKFHAYRTCPRCGIATENNNDVCPDCWIEYALHEIF